MSERKELLGKLRSIQMELFRCSADLDEAIRKIEMGLDEPATDEMIRLFIRCEQNYRDDKIKFNGWGELLKLEGDIWQQLFEVKEES